MDPQKLLEQFLGPGGLSGMLGQLGGMIGGQQQNPPHGGAGRTDNKEGGLAGGVGDLMNHIPGGAAGALAGAGLLGVLLGQKKVRKMAGGLLGAGASAALGALAYRAWQNWNSGQPAAVAPVASIKDAPPEGSPFLPKADASGQPFALALIKAMIAAANADGHIGADEHKQIFDAANRAGFDAEAKAFIFDALAAPPSVRQIASMASGMEQAAELYLAARLAIDPDHPSEKAFLDALAQAMGLPPQFVDHLEQQVTGAATNGL